MKKIILNSTVLFHVLEFARKAMESNSIVPIFTYFFCAVKKGVLSVSGSNMYITAIARMTVEAKEDFNFMMPLNVLKYVKEMEEQPVVISYDPSTHKIELKNEDGTAKYCGEDPNDFPKPVEFKSSIFQYPADYLGVLKDLVEYCGKDELRPALTGVNFMFKQGGVFEMAATNGHILKTQIIPSLQKQFKKDQPQDSKQLFILPWKAAKILSELKAEKSDVLNVTHSAIADSKFKYVSFAVENSIISREVQAKVINERYPDYQNVIPFPADITTKYTFAKRFMVDLLAKAPNFYNQTTKQVELRLNQENPQFFVENMNEGNEFVSDLKKNTDFMLDGQEIQIAFNCEFLQQVIKSGALVQTLELRKANQGATIRTDETTVLLMPVMIHSYK